MLEDESYDFELIDELFNPKKKFKLVKPDLKQLSKINNPYHYPTTEGAAHDEETTNSNHQHISAHNQAGNQLRKQGAGFFNRLNRK